MKELVMEIAKSLVDHPEDVKVEDIGQVIGKQGKIANSIRTIAKAAGTKRDLKVFIEILD